MHSIEPRPVLQEPLMETGPSSCINKSEVELLKIFRLSMLALH